MTFFPDPKIKTARSEEFLAFIRKQKCLVCPASPCDPAHEGGGMGIRGSDYFALPLCRKHHDEQHKGFVSFYEKYLIDPWRERALLIERYIAEGLG